MPKVLLIEDDKEATELYTETLSENGFEVHSCPRGKDGIVEAAKWKPDVILLDIRMPEMDGMLTLKHLKDLEETHNIPVIFLTLLPKELHESHQVAQAESYLEKAQTGPKELIETINTIINRQSHAES